MVKIATALVLCLTLVSAAQAIPAAPFDQPETLITEARTGCGVGMVMRAGHCVSRHEVRQTRRCVRWNGAVCAAWH